MLDIKKPQKLTLDIEDVMSCYITASLDQHTYTLIQSDLYIPHIAKQSNVTQPFELLCNPNLGL